jgi:hypothetical protein
LRGTRGDEAISERPDDVRHEIATSLSLLAMTCPFDVVASGTGVQRSTRTASRADGRVVTVRPEEGQESVSKDERLPRALQSV